ncbi:MAG: helix-turn-helix domain-containing protein [Tenericutes bacterium]|nr:helix-turn-helix domain-containing protein [Mycoplasmatota bacterium]
MNQIKIGNYISEKRKKQNLTQSELAEKLAVSNKTVSKWECANCMPDYSVIESLCEVLKISVSELLNGEDDKTVSDEKMLDMLNRIQSLEKEKKTITGILLIFLGICCYLISSTLGGSDVKDFFSGVLVGLSIGEMLTGVYIVAKSMAKEQK